MDDKKKADLVIEEQRRRKAYWIGFVIAFVVSIGLAIGTFFIVKDGLALDWEKDKWHILADTFTIPGVMFLMVFLLVKVSDFGAFDAIAYSVRLVVTVIFRSNVRKSKLPVNYRDYRLARMAKQRTSATFLLLVGGIHLAVAIIFIILFSVKA